MSDDCIFCRIVKGDIPSYCIYQDDALYAFLDINPLSPGHCLLIPKDHHPRLDSCPEPLIVALAQKLVPIACAVVTAVDAKGYNILNNTGRAAGQLIDHLHFHIIPRNPDDLAISHRAPIEYPPGRPDQLVERIKTLL